MRVRFLVDLSDGHHGGLGGREVFLRYCTVAGDEVATTWEQARADLIVEGLPVRVPPTYRAQRSYPGLFWAATNDRTLVYESLLELDRLWLADFDPAVVKIGTQPFQITGREGADLRAHVPDLLLVHADHSVTVVDVKPSSMLDSKLAIAIPISHAIAPLLTRATRVQAATSPLASPSAAPGRHMAHSLHSRRRVILRSRPCPSSQFGCESSTTRRIS